MTTMIQIRSVKQFLKDFIVDPAEKNGNDWLIKHLDLVKSNLLNAFRKEVFEQIVDKLGPETLSMELDDLAKVPGIDNILQQSFRKWRRLCIICSEQGLGQFLGLEDLKDELMKGPEGTLDGHGEVVLPNPGEDVTDRMSEILPDGQEPVYLNGGLTVEEGGERCAEPSGTADGES